MTDATAGVAAGGVTSGDLLSSDNFINKVYAAIFSNNYVYLIGVFITFVLICVCIYLLFSEGYDDAKTVVLGDSAFSSETMASTAVPAAMHAPTRPTVQSAPPQSYENKDLVHLTVLGACNAAYGGGGSVHNDANILRYHIDRGMRAFDFEVYDDGDNGILVVGYGGNNRANTSNLWSVRSEGSDSTAITLNNIIGTLRNALNAVYSPTYTDPLFIHLRLQVSESAADAVCSNIYSYMESNFGDKWGGTAIKPGHALLYIDGTTAPWLTSMNPVPTVRKLSAKLAGVTGVTPLIYRGQAEVDRAIAAAGGDVGETNNTVVPGVVMADVNTSKQSLMTFVRKDKPINLAKIGESNIAPKFNIIFQPFYVRDSNITFTERIFDTNVIMSLDEFYTRVVRERDRQNS